MKKKNTVLDNAALAHYLAIKAEIKRLEAEADAIKDAIIERGSFTTDEYEATVAMQQQFRTVDADQLCTVLDPVFVAKNNLIKKIEFPRVTVKLKKDVKAA
jgi:hypothetical protein